MGDGVSIQTKKALIESGAYTPEDLGLVSAPKPSNEATWAVGGSSAAADQRQVTGETPLQQRQRQDAQLKALLEARKRKGYTKGGIIKPTYNVQNPMEHAQSYTQDKSIEQMQDDSLNAIKRGLRTWPGELPAFLA